MAGAMSSRRALLDPASRIRAGRAKALVVVGGAAVFALGFGLTRASHPSHPKHKLTRLDPPAGFVQQLRQDQQLRGGFVAPPQAPPEAQTAAS
jgi:putative NADH-flavin reductase